MISNEMKSKIDAMNYEAMLRIWRFAPMGADIVSGEVGDYFKESMLTKKAALGDSEQVQISKTIGWG
jgi:hypothetical protein